MDINHDMMMHQLMEEEATAFIDGDEHFTILAALL
jgi:hypothetical protein